MRVSYTGSVPDTPGFSPQRRATRLSNLVISILLIVSVWGSAFPSLFPVSAVPNRHTLSAPGSGKSELNLREPAFVKAARRGFSEMYNLDYDQAIETFRSLKAEYPQHPAPPLYLAILSWLKELLDRQDLDLDRFIAPGYFTKATDREMASARRKAFFGDISESQRLCRNILAGQPAHPDARYFLGTSLGVLGSFAFTIDRKKIQALRYGKQAYNYHRDLMKEDPAFYDSYLSVGLYEYIVGNLPWYIKWLAAIAGYSGSAKRGFEYLELAAEKAHYVADDSRVLLMVLNVREKRHDRALSIARTLHGKYPRSFLLHLNKAQLLERMGRLDESVREYQSINRKG